jgi:LPXTG-motif cell wall-anchored protein
VPKTGDSAPVALWIGLILVGLIGFGGAFARNVKRQK